MRGGIVALGMVMVFVGIVSFFLPLVNLSLATAIMGRLTEMGLGIFSLQFVGMVFGVIGFMVFLTGLVAKEG